MNSVDTNNLQDRIDDLYHASDSFVQREAFAPINVEEEHYTDENGKQITRVSFGGGKLAKQDSLEAKQIARSMVSNLADLKDPTKNELKKLGLDGKIVEECINQSRCLSLIIDINNAYKHGYPLTKSKRTNDDPKIANIRKEMIIPLKSGQFTNAFSEGMVVIEADIHDLGNNKIYNFREMIEEAIFDWEEFYLKWLPNESREIAKRRANEEKQKTWEADHIERKIQVDKIVSNENNWHPILGNQVVTYMFVRAKGRQKGAATLMGYPNDQPNEMSNKECVSMFDVVFGNQTKLSKEENEWHVLVVDSQATLKLVSDYYWELYNPPKFE